MIYFYFELRVDTVKQDLSYEYLRSRQYMYRYSETQLVACVIPIQSNTLPLKSSYRPQSSCVSRSSNEFGLFLSYSDRCRVEDPLVPSIAMEFTRNRQQHDQTAKQWTDLYAKPPPPPAPLPTEKKKAPPAVAEGSTSRRVADRPQQSETITIDDSDEEESVSGAVLLPPAKNGKGKKRKREVGVVADEVEIIGDEDNEGDDHVKGKRNRAADGSESRRDRRSGHGMDTAQRQKAEVIVIDD
jgi:hypothetical protein